MDTKKKNPSNKKEEAQLKLEICDLLFGNCER